MIIYKDMHIPSMFLSLYRESGVSAQSTFRSRGTAFLSRFFGYHLPTAFYYRLPRVAEDDDKIILFDSGASQRFVELLHQRYPEKRIILYFWNPIRFSWYTEVDWPLEVWTYSKKDARQYGLRFNPQFYFDVLADEAKNSVPPSISRHPKVLFVGRVKGRMAAINELKDELTKAGAEVELYLVKPPRHLANLVEKTIPYRKVVEMIKKADIILDYSKDPNAGLSLRPLEALFWQKKLITNSTAVMDTDFYHPNNIYVLGKDDRSLKEFFLCEPHKIDESIKDRYRLSTWLKRFDEVEECTNNP